MTLGATHGRDFGCYHSLSAAPWDTPQAFRFAMYRKRRLASSRRKELHELDDEQPHFLCDAPQGEVPRFSRRCSQIFSKSASPEARVV